MEIIPINPETVPIRSSEDVVVVRQKVRQLAAKLGFSVVNQTKIITAASELGRNTLEYGGGGQMQMEELHTNSKMGIRLIFIDEGPGIADIKLAMTDGYTSGNGLGLGLSGSRRLVHEFSIESAPGNGTRVSITQWK